MKITEPEKHTWSVKINTVDEACVTEVCAFVHASITHNQKHLNVNERKLCKVMKVIQGHARQLLITVSMESLGN